MKLIAINHVAKLGITFLSTDANIDENRLVLAIQEDPHGIRRIVNSISEINVGYLLG